MGAACDTDLHGAESLTNGVDHPPSAIKARDSEARAESVGSGAQSRLVRYRKMPALAVRLALFVNEWSRGIGSVGGTAASGVTFERRNLNNPGTSNGVALNT